MAIACLLSSGSGSVRGFKSADRVAVVVAQGAASVRALRCDTVRPTAAMRTTPWKICGAQVGPPERRTPRLPVPRSSTANTVPHELKRPPRSWVAPRKAAENAGIRYEGPVLGSAAWIEAV